MRGYVRKLVTLAVGAATVPALLLSGAGTAQAGPADGNPDVSFRQALTNLGPQLTVNIRSNTDKGANCTYSADGWLQRSFYLNGRDVYTLNIVPAVPKFGNWSIVVGCDNGKETRTTYFY